MMVSLTRITRPRQRCSTFIRPLYYRFLHHAEEHVVNTSSHETPSDYCTCAKWQSSWERRVFLINYCMVRTMKVVSLANQNSRNYPNTVVQCRWWNGGVRTTFWHLLLTFCGSIRLSVHERTVRSRVVLLTVHTLHAIDITAACFNCLSRHFPSIQSMQ